MSFATMNGVTAAKGLAGSARDTTATFNPTASQPLPQGGYAQGMGGPAPAPEPTGSSYTHGGGMGLSSRIPGSAGGPTQRLEMGPNDHGVAAGQTMASPIGQAPRPMTAEEMNDPDNAALAGFAFAATQDRPMGPSTNPQAQPAPQAAPVGPRTSTGLNTGAMTAMQSQGPQYADVVHSDAPLAKPTLGQNQGGINSGHLSGVLNWGG